MRKTALFLLVSLLLLSCQDKSQQYGKLLTLADLKFPLIDEDNGEQLMPKPYKKNLFENNVAAKVAIPIENDITDR